MSQRRTDALVWLVLVLDAAWVAYRNDLAGATLAVILAYAVAMPFQWAAFTMYAKVRTAGTGLVAAVWALLFGYMATAMLSPAMTAAALMFAVQYPAEQRRLAQSWVERKRAIAVRVARGRVRRGGLTA